VDDGVEFHDSRLAGVDPIGRDLVIRLAPAIVHRSEGGPGVDAGMVGLQEVEIVIHDAAGDPFPVRFPVDLADGSLAMAGRRWDGVVPIPFEAVGSVEVEAITEEGERLGLRGDGVAIRAVGAWALLEAFPDDAP